MSKHFKSGMSVLVCALMIISNVISSPPAQAAGPWYVAPTGNDGNSCLSAGSPCATINGAVGKASPGDIIKVAIGAYTGISPEGVLLDKSVTLSGGWNATFTSANGLSTIDGQGSSHGITVNNNVVTVIERFIIQNGASGVYNIGGTVTLNNSIIQNNSGTGIRNGLYAGFSMTLNNSIVTNNSGYLGGGIFNLGDLIINNSIISGNTTFGSGGGINNPNENTTVTLNNSAVLSNTGTSGGGIFVGDGTVILNNSTVSSNAASSEGGGIKTGGGGIMILNSSTVSGNTASNIGGGIAGGGGFSTVTLRNTIVANNNAASGGADCAGPIVSAGYNLIETIFGGYCAFTYGSGDRIEVDPKLGLLQNNGGPTPTHALLPGSLALNAGNPAGCRDNSGNLFSIDQRGTARSGRCDIGAYELGSFARMSVTGMFRPSSVVTYTITLGPNAF